MEVRGFAPIDLREKVSFARVCAVKGFFFWKIPSRPGGGHGKPIYVCCLGALEGTKRGPNRPGVPKVFPDSCVKIEKTNSNSTRDFSKRINFTRVDPFVWSTLVVKIKKRRNPLRAYNRDKEDIILLPVDWGLSAQSAGPARPVF